ncbi:MAG TPA: sigma-54-dependent Fis family transcriptional regulator [Rubrivivax sp.]|jgi:transcriptional regulator with GAF, ATPase, and Fis domain|nr:sigma-54-dependent Fis family transcriptional regulator [Rubrivivax sp.]
MDSTSQAVAPTSDDTSPQEWIAFERLLADLAAQFANVPALSIEHDIEQAMARLIAFLGFDRSSLLFLQPDGSTLKVLCSVAATPYDALPRGLMTAHVPWLMGELRAGRSPRLSHLPQGLPPQAVEERRFVVAEGIRSQMIVPLREGGQLVGFITLVAFKDTRTWPDELVARLSTVGHVFAQALARARTDRALAAALAEVRSLKERLEAENHYLRDAARLPAKQALASRSPRFQRVLDEVAQVAPTPSTVLLLGETGCGKEVLAEALHEASPRRQRPMIRINCAALPAALIEAELFGREKGAYTGALARQPGRFELADGSTLFLDEIGEMPIELQTRLLRVLQDGRFERVGGTQTLSVDVRLVAATHRDLQREVEAGRFREDLYYRLNVFPIAVPALRERREDIPMLAWAFVKEFAATFGKPTERIDDASMAALQAHAWPGNVRELRNTIERAMILSRGPTLHVELAPARAAAVRPRSQAMPPVTRDEAEHESLRQALVHSGWRIRGSGGAAERLGIKPTTLESRMKKLGLQRPHAGSDEP